MTEQCNQCGQTRDFCDKCSPEIMKAKPVEIGEKPLPDLIVTRNGVPFADQAEGIRKFKEACLAAKQERPRPASDADPEEALRLAAVLIQRGKNNSLHDINRAAEMLTRFAVRAL